MSQNNIKRNVQQRGESLAYEAKCLFKSHSIALFLQFILLISPIIIGSFALRYEIDSVWEVIGFLISILALVYYIFYGRNTQLYKEYGEKYISLHNELKEYYIGGNYSVEEFNKYKVKHSEINDLWKPTVHFGSLCFVNRTIEKEMLSGNEKKLWWKE